MRPSATQNTGTSRWAFEQFLVGGRPSSMSRESSSVEPRRRASDQVPTRELLANASAVFEGMLDLTTNSRHWQRWRSEVQYVRAGIGYWVPK